MADDLDFWDSSCCLRDWIAIEASRISLPTILLPDNGLTAAERLEGMVMIVPRA